MSKITGWGLFWWGASFWGGIGFLTPVVTHSDGEAYEFEDMNRVGTDIQYLADLLNVYGYAVSVAPKTDWVRGEIPTPTQFAQYLADLNSLKTAFYGSPELPTSMDDFEEVGANNIEKLLLEVEDHLTQMSAAFRYCGELICGEDQ